MNQQKIYGRHAVGEALEERLDISELFILGSGQGGELRRILELAGEQGVTVRQSSRQELDRMLPGARHQGVIALCSLPQPVSLDDLLKDYPREKPLLLLDGVEDPHNLGAIIRSTEALGGGGLVIRRRRSVGLTPGVVKASVGAALRLKVAEVPNLHQAIRRLKDVGFWIYGLDARGETTIWDLDMSGSLALVLGGEGEGISRLVRDSCDGLVRIPMRGGTGSLNVSVSAALALGEWGRRMQSAECRVQSEK